MAALARANEGHADSYGADEATERVEALFRRHFGDAARAYLVFNGSAANVACLDAVLAPHQAAIVTESAHLNVDECGAPERITGTKLLTVPTAHGKLGPDQLRWWEERRGDEHSAQPALVSITQSTELGTVYGVDEIKAIAAAAHELGMLVHMDGARIANAAASLGKPLRAITADAGVDLLSFGGTKNGLMFGEAVVVLREGLAEHFKFVRKQLLQLNSKMRFAAVQFEALLAEGLWLENARNANQMAERLAAAARDIEAVEIVHPVEANAVFARLPRAATDRLLAELPGKNPFYVWDQAAEVVRWVTSWDTTAEDVDSFAAALGEAVRS
jgi:threonine aldolase